MIDLPDWIENETFLEYCNFRKSINKPLKNCAKRRLIRRLDDFRKCGYDPNFLLEVDTLSEEESFLLVDSEVSIQNMHQKT